MSHPEDIIRLYSTILFHDVRRHYVSDDDMKAAIEHMQRVYMPDKENLSSSVRRLADYNSMAYRCAYLHKYAPFHTAMVSDIMKCILQQNDNMYRVFQRRFATKQKFKICSLGGGPGSDIVGILLTMFQQFGLFPCSAKVIDIKSDWKDTLASVIRGLGSGMYGPVGEGFTPRNFIWDYMTADLLEEVHDDVKFAIGSAELVTMVKFVSAAACKNTEWMLKKIFTMLKVGAAVLFIDNSSGGFRQLVSKAATNCNLTSVWGPINYQIYTNEAFKITHWNHTSCYSTTVTVHMMQKLQPSPSFNISPKKIFDSAPKSDNKPSSKQPVKNSEVDAEDVRLQEEIQGKSLKDLKEFNSKIAELEKTISTNRDQMTKLKETIQTLEKCKADVGDYKVEILSAKEEIINLKKELEKAKLQEQSALFEREKQVKEMDVKMTELVTARKEDFALIEQLQHEKKLLVAEMSKMKMNLQQTEKLKGKEKRENVNEKGKRKRSTSEANKATEENSMSKENSNSKSTLSGNKRQRVLRSRHPNVVEPLDNLLQKQENMPQMKEAMQSVGCMASLICESMIPRVVKSSCNIISVAQSGSSTPSPQVTHARKRLLKAVTEPKKAKPKWTESVSSMPSLRLTPARKKLLNADAGIRKTEEPKRTQSVSSMSSPRVIRSCRKLFNADGRLKR